MKKFMVTILAFLYISTSTGAIINVHYCMGKLAGWEFGQQSSNTCGKCGMEKSDKKDNGCCKDEHKFVKNDSDQKTAETGIQLSLVMSAALPVSFFEVPVNHVASVTEENPLCNAPPRNHGIAEYLLNRTFLI
jgi:hypothetical protein